MTKTVPLTYIGEARDRKGYAAVYGCVLNGAGDWYPCVCGWGKYPLEVRRVLRDGVSVDPGDYEIEYHEYLALIRFYKEQRDFSGARYPMTVEVGPSGEGSS